MTREKFISELRRQFSEEMKGEDPSEVRKFLDDEASDIDDFYRWDLGDRCRAEMDEDAFWKACISSHVYCLELMF